MSQKPTYEELEQRVKELEQADMQRRQVEKALKESEKKYQTVFRTTAAGIAITSLEFAQVLDINETFSKLIGLSRQEVVGKTSFEIGFWPNLENREKIITELKREGRFQNLEIEYLDRQNNLRTGLFSCEVIEIGNQPCILTVMVDVSDYRKTKVILKESEEKYRILFNQSSMGIYLHDLDGRILDCNQVASVQSGYSRDELLRLNIFNLHLNEELASSIPNEKILSSWHQWQSGQRLIYNGEQRRKDGTVYPVEISTGLVSFRNETFILAIYQDITERKQAEEKQRDLEAKLSNAMEIAKLGHWKYDVKGDCFTFNDQFYKIFRTSVEQIGGYSMSSMEYVQRFVHPEDREMVKDEIRKNLEMSPGGLSRQIEHRILYINGDVGYISVQYFLVKDEQGKTIRTYGVNQDITERKQAELKIHDSESNFRDVVSSIPGAVYQFLLQTDGTFEIPFMSSGAKNILDIPVEEFNDVLVLFRFIHPDDFKDCMASIKKSAETMKTWQHEFRIRTDSGLIKWVRGVSNPTRLSNGTIRWTGVLQDITERIQAAEALRESEQLYRTLFEQNLNPIAIINLEGNYLDANQSFLNFVEKSKIELLQMNAFDFEPPDSKNTQRQKHMPIWETGGTIETEYHINGKVKILELTITPISYRRKDALIGIGKDVTDRKRLEAQLIEAQKMEAIGTLAGGIAHDFNNILSPMIGYTELLNFEISPQSPHHAYVDGIYQAAMRARELVKQILLFSRNAPHEVKPLKLQPLVREALKLLQSSIPSTVEVLSDIDPNCGPVVADPTQIHQIVMNLGTNAYHAMEENGGRMDVSLYQVELDEENSADIHTPAGTYACLTFADTGVGVPKSVSDKIFDPYFTTKEKGKGTGLGLSVVQGIVKNSGGFIRLHSIPGEGTEFRVFLPILKKMKTAPDTEAVSLIRCGNERLLLIDDETAVLKMMHSLLKRIGYQVTSYSSSMEALDAFKMNHDRFDLVITDMTMPIMTGDRLAQEFFQIKPDIPVILCTGYSEKMNWEKANILGIKGFLMKPVGMSELSTTVRTILDGGTPEMMQQLT